MSTPPKEFATAGRRLWRAVTEKYDLERHEAEVLRNAARVADRIAQLDEVVDAEGVVCDSSQGVRAHPALVESRQQRIALARLLASIRLPVDAAEDDTAGQREQARSGARGVYGLAAGDG